MFWSVRFHGPACGQSSPSSRKISMRLTGPSQCAVPPPLPVQPGPGTILAPLDDPLDDVDLVALAGARGIAERAVLQLDGRRARGGGQEQRGQDGEGESSNTHGSDNSQWRAKSCGMG